MTLIPHDYARSKYDPVLPGVRDFLRKYDDWFRPLLERQFDQAVSKMKITPEAVNYDSPNLVAAVGGEIWNSLLLEAMAMPFDTDAIYGRSLASSADEEDTLDSYSGPCRPTRDCPCC